MLSASDRTRINNSHEVHITCHCHDDRQYYRQGLGLILCTLPVKFFFSQKVLYRFPNIVVNYNLNPPDSSLQEDKLLYAFLNFSGSNC